MALNEFEQLQKLISESNYILIIFNGKNNGDTITSALALKMLLEKQHKQADIVATDFIAQKNLRFLPHYSDIKPTLAQLQKFIIKVDVSKSPIETISYDVRDNTLSIYLTPKDGIISKNELRTAQSSFKYDLIITLNTPDLDSLDQVFFNNTDLFYKTPIINIDHQPNNERYGQINLVDLTSTSLSEVIFKSMKKISPEHITGDIATALLTGMTIATKSFRNSAITPFTLQLASELINHGAEREKIVDHLYRTRSMATLKLWGQALTHLQHDPKLGIVWTSITREDFARSGGHQEELPGIIDELISNAPEAKIIVLLYETGDGVDKKISGIVATEKNYDALHVVKPLNPTGTKKHAAVIFQNKTLKEAEETMLATLRDSLGREGIK